MTRISAIEKQIKTIIDMKVKMNESLKEGISVGQMFEDLKLPMPTSLMLQK
jgi:hypothetical protein